MTAAELNSNIRDAGNFFLSVPLFEGRQTVAQSVANSAVAGITLDVEDVDTDNGHSTSSNTSRYTAQTTGRYQVGGAVGFVSGTAAGIRQCLLDVNGTITGGSASIVQGTIANAIVVPLRTRTVFLNSGTDYVELLGFQSSGGALNTDVSGDHQSGMLVRWVGTT